MNYKSLMLSLGLLLCPGIYAENSLQTVKASVFLLAAQAMPTAYPQLNCKFAPWRRAQNEILKWLFNEYVLQDSVNWSVALDPVGNVNILNSDQFMEVGAAAVASLLANASTQEVVKVAGKTYVREQIVAALVWLLNQSGLTNLLPSNVTNNDLWDPAVKQVGRFEVDEHVISKL